jgi:hypothetical protein
VQNLTMIRGERRGVPARHAGGPGQRLGGRDREGGVEQRPGQLPQGGPDPLGIVGVTADGIEGAGKLLRARLRRERGLEGVGHGALRRHHGRRLERVQQRAQLARGRRIVQTGEGHLFVAGVVPAEVDGSGGIPCGEHAEGEIEEADRPAEVGDGADRQPSGPLVEGGLQQQLR